MDCQYKFCVLIVHLFLESEETDYYIYGNIMVTTSTVVQLIAKKDVYLMIACWLLQFPPFKLLLATIQ